MSRVGRKPITVPEKVKLNLKANLLSVEGPKGKLSLTVHPRMKVDVTEKEVTVKRPTNTRQDRSLHGLTRALIQNTVLGVSEGFSKSLKIEGVGFRAQLKGKTLVLSLGYSHPINYAVPEGVEVKVGQQNTLTVSGINKKEVGQVAADIRRFYEPEPYGGKGVRYADEVVRRKQGKTVG